MVFAPRLARATLRHARAAVAMPPARGARRIVHLGLGAFARAHLATYVEDAALAGGEAWSVLGVSLQRPDQRDRLAPQNWLYAAVERGPDRTRARIIGCLEKVLVAPEDPHAVLAALAAPETEIVTLTTTEKGYCHDPARGTLDFAHPDIRHDLATPTAPRSVIGFLVEALRQRRAAALPPFTVLCCDNLPANGRLVGSLVQEFAGRRDAGLAGWIAQEGAFPCSMVDRIVPATTEADIALAAAVTGFTDAAPVFHEPFRQFVIENRFVQGRPAWEAAGVELVSDVEPFELMKLRLLNGAHSALAYLGLLAGHETIAASMADPALALFVERYWEEMLPTVPPPASADLRAYTRALAKRFLNPAIRHRTAQIAMDGSQKLPQRVLQPARERLANGLGIPCLALIVAAWARALEGTDDAGQAIAIQDPLAERLRARLMKAAAAPGAKMSAFLSEAAIFGDDLPQNGRLVAAVTTAYAALLQDGARATAASCGAASVPGHDKD